jgi:uncharacterized protein (DUF1810 family)
MNTKNLNRFLEAQNNTYKKALKEIKAGRKTGHWMWYIFPQITGLGSSETSRFYAIKSMDEAAQYLQHPVLGKRLVEISEALLKLKSDNPESIFGYIDSLKLKSSMTLFSSIENANSVFKKVIEKFYAGEKDTDTLKKLKH